MAHQEAETNSNDEHASDFELPRYNAIHEDNWAEFEARGFQPVSSEDSIGIQQMMYGVANIYTGDMWDQDAKRPLRHKPGVGHYVSPEGIKYAEKKDAERERWMSEHGYGDAQSSDDPAVN